MITKVFRRERQKEITQTGIKRGDVKTEQRWDLEPRNASSHPKLKEAGNRFPRAPSEGT